MPRSITDSITQLTHTPVMHWPRWAQYIGSALLLAVLGWLGYTLFLAPRYTQLAAQQRLLARLTLAIAQARATAQALPPPTATARDAATLGGGAHTPLLTLLHQAALVHEVYIEHVHAANDTRPSRLQQSTLHITLTGSYQALRNFIAELTTLPYHMQLHNLSLTSELSAQVRLAADLTASGEVSGRLRPRSTAPASSRCVAAHGTQQLALYEPSQLALVGTIIQHKVRMALVRTPHGEIVRVPLGSHVGPRADRVTTLDEYTLTLEECIEQHDGRWVGRQLKLSLPRGGRSS